MSSRYAVLSSIDTTIDLIKAEQVPLDRVCTALEAIDQSKRLLRKALAESVYEARMSCSPQEILEATGVPWWTVRRMVAEHLADNPGLPRPRSATALPDIEYIDLSGGSSQSSSSQ